MNFLLLSLTLSLVKLSASQFTCPDQNKFILFTPGPVRTTKSVRQSSAEDLAINQDEIKSVIEFIRSNTLRIAGVSKAFYTSILLPGSGTFAIEASILTSLPKTKGKVLVLTNGFFGERLIDMCKSGSTQFDVLRWKYNEDVDLEQIEAQLSKNRDYSTVVMVHHETNWGYLNPIQEVGQLVKKYIPDATYIVDAVSSFGCVPIDIEKSRIDFLIFTSNKCLQGLPGFGIVIANKLRLMRSKGLSRSYSLDLYQHYQSYERTGTFTFTFPVQIFLAAKQAIAEYQHEGDTQRTKRLKTNSRIIRAGMEDLGFRLVLPENKTSFILTSYHIPKSFNFEEFKQKLKMKGFILANGLEDIPLFRISHIGNLREKECKDLLATIKQILKEMKVRLPLQ